MRWSSTSGTARRMLAGFGAAVLLLSGAAATAAAPREDLPQSPPERERNFALDVDALAHSLAELPDPLPVPPVDGTRACVDLPARAATYPLFDGETFVLPPRRDAELCAAEGKDGPVWTLTWSGLIQDPAIAGTGGMRAWGLWSLVASEDGWLAALGDLDDGRQFTYAPYDWTQVKPELHRLEGRSLDRSRFATTTLPPLVIHQTTTTSGAAPAATAGTDAAAAQAVAGSPGYTG